MPDWQDQTVPVDWRISCKRYSCPNLPHKHWEMLQWSKDAPALLLNQRNSHGFDPCPYMQVLPTGALCHHTHNGIPCCLHNTAFDAVRKVSDALLMQIATNLQATVKYKKPARSAGRRRF